MPSKRRRTGDPTPGGRVLTHDEALAARTPLPPAPEKRVTILGTGPILVLGEGNVLRNVFGAPMYFNVRNSAFVAMEGIINEALAKMQKMAEDDLAAR